MRRSFALLAALVALLACSDLKRAEDEGGAVPDGGGASGDGAADGSVDPPSTDAGADVGAAPLDFECTEYWIKATKTNTECAPRQVTVIDDGVPDVQDVSIARTSAGRVGIAYYAPEFADAGETRFFHFTPTTAAFKTEAVPRPSMTIGHQPGYHVKLSASAPDTFHMLAHDVYDGTSGDLVHLRLVNGTKPWTNPEVVLSALGYRTEIALASDASGSVLASARQATGTTGGGLEIAKLVVRRKMSGGAFGALPDLAVDLSPDEAPGVGAASLAFDAAGTPNVLFHHCESASGSAPRYHAFDGALWTGRKTVDNVGLDGHAGFSPRLAVYGGRKIAAFFYRQDLQGQSSTADLRVATWSAVIDTPNIKIVEQGLPSSDLLDPKYRVAMAVDKYGLVHLAVVSPNGSNGGTLDYWRETPVDGGGTQWLRDIVDDNVLAADQYAAVDLVVDENARPHIAYRSAADFKIRYATRYDR